MEETEKKGESTRNEETTPTKRLTPRNGGRKKAVPDLDVIERYARAGLTEHQLALCLRVSEHTLLKWRRDKKWGPLMEQATKKGHAQANERVQQSLFKRAVGYSYEKVTYEEKVDKTGALIPTTKREIIEYAPSEVAAMMWLSNKDPDNWKQKQDIGITQNTRYVPVELSKLSPEERKAYLLKLEAEKQRRLGVAKSPGGENRALQEAAKDAQFEEAPKDEVANPGRQ